MSLGPRTGVVAVVALVVVLLCCTTATGDVFSLTLDDGRTDYVEAARIDGAWYFRLADLARAVGASRHWNPRTSKMSLAVGIHRVSMASDSQFVALDGESINVHRPVVMRDGEYWTPVRFLTRALGLAVNSEITVDGPGEAISIVKLGALVMSVGLEERPGATVAVVALNDRAEFSVSSRERGRIDFFLPGAALLDSLDVLDGVGLISSVELVESEAGVNGVVRVAPSATAYDAQMHTNPPRLEVVVVAEREQMWRSVAMEEASREAMARARVGIDDIAYLDLYSCFPCVPRIVRDALEIEPTDPRPRPVTGGMSNFGGPGNNYSLHAVCRMAEILREHPGKTGLVQSVSWYLSKHGVGAYRSGACPNAWNRVGGSCRSRDTHTRG